MNTLLVLTGVTSQLELDEELRANGPGLRRCGKMVFRGVLALAWRPVRFGRQNVHDVLILAFAFDSHTSSSVIHA